MQIKPKTACINHPSFDIEALCFHPQCRQKRQQLVCYRCGSEEGDHSTHHQYMEPLHLITQVLKQITSFETSSNQELLKTQFHEANVYLDEIKGSIINDFNKWKQKQMARLMCLTKFLDQSSLSNLFNRFSNQEQLHSTCCMHLINFLYDSTKASHLNPDLIQNTLTELIATNYRTLLVKANNLRQIVQEMIQSKDYDLLCISNHEVKIQIQEKAAEVNQTIKQSFRRCLNDIRQNGNNSGFLSRQKDWRQLQKSVDKNILNEDTTDKSEQSYFEHVYSSFKKKMPEIVPLGQEQISTQNQQQIQPPRTSIYKNKSQMIHKSSVKTRRSYGRKEFPIEIQEKLAEGREFSQKRLRKRPTAETVVRDIINSHEKMSVQLPQIVSLHEGEVECGDEKNPQENRRRSLRLKNIEKANYLDCQIFPNPQECPKCPVSTSPSEKIYKKGLTQARGSSRVESSLKGLINSSSKHRQK